MQLQSNLNAVFFSLIELLKYMIYLLLIINYNTFLV